MITPEPGSAPKSRHSHQLDGPDAEPGTAGTTVVGSFQPPPSGTTPDPTAVVPTAASRLRDALSALAQPPARDPVTQRFIGANVEAGKTLSRSTQFWSAVEPAKRELVERVRADLAVDGDSIETLLGLIDGYAEARLFRMSMFLRLVDQGGPITNKGKARALYRGYLDALDRETKLAQVLGLERKSKRVPSLAEVMSE